MRARALAKVWLWRRWPLLVIMFCGLVALVQLISLRLSAQGSLPSGYALHAAWSAWVPVATWATAGCVAYVVAERIELGICQQGEIAGISFRRQLLIDGAVGAGAALGSALMLMALTAICIFADHARALSDPAFVDRSPGHELAVWVGAALVVALTGALVGLVLGAATASRMAVIGCVVLGASISLITSELGGQLGAAQYINAALPSGALTELLRINPGFDTSSPVRAVAAASLAALVLVGPVAIGYARSAGLDPAGKASRAAGRIRVAALVIIVPTAFGFAVPVALRSQVPWPLRPLWIADRSAHRTSADIVTRALTEVREGDPGSSGLVDGGGSAERLLGPYLQVLRSAPRFRARVIERADGDPGTVEVTIPGVQVFQICTIRQAQGWRLVRVTSSNDCARVET